MMTIPNDFAKKRARTLTVAEVLEIVWGVQGDMLRHIPDEVPDDDGVAGYDIGVNRFAEDMEDRLMGDDL